MSVQDESVSRLRAGAPARKRQASMARRGGLLGGGPDGNEVLTTSTGVLLLVLLAALGVTIVFIGQLLSEHLFIGLLLLGPVVLKMGSTGYRFFRYYAGQQAYTEKGPPRLALRLTAPIVVLSTLAVFITGLILLAVGPANRDPWVQLHKVTFFVWLAFTALHVIGHLPEVSRLLGTRAEILQLPGVRTDLSGVERPAHPRAGTSGRAILLAGSLLIGLIIAVVLIPDYHTWIAALPYLHHHHGAH